MVCLVAALLLLLPLPLAGTLALVRRWRRISSAVPHVAVMELRAGRTRALAISATGAIAVFGSVAIQAAHGDLLQGLENAAHDMNAFTDVWVSRPAPTTCCRPRRLRRRRASGQVRAAAGRACGAHLSRRAARLGRAAHLDDRATARVLAAAAGEPDRRRQVRARRHARVRAGGWAVLSRAIAEEHHLQIGSAFTLPRPTRRGCASRRCPRTSAGRPGRS